MPLLNMNDMLAEGVELPTDPDERRIRLLLGDMRQRAQHKPSRELSLALTSLEQALLWLKVANGSAS